MTLRTLNYGNYGIFLIMGNAGFCPPATPNPRLQDAKIQEDGLNHNTDPTRIYGRFRV